MKNLSALLLCLSVSPYLLAQSPFKAPAPIPGENGTELRLFAKEPFLRNTVAVAVGEDGKVYATSVVRRKAADLDIRQFRNWIEKDLSLKTVEEKRAFLRSELTPENAQRYKKVGDQNKDGVIDWKDLTVLTDRIIVLEDTDGDGLADRSDTFAEGFNTEVTGIAAGLEAWDGKVYATVEPDLVRLQQTEGSPATDQRDVLATGFSVRLSYAGHNFSGPIVGPDGRLYMSSPDKGMHVTSREGKTFSHPLSGTVARCELDGSNFEVFAYGLRNAQEIAFDQFGNLFSVDNDGDMKGEKERLIYITKGSDHGWRYHWQYLKNRYQPWMIEGLSKTHHPGRPAFSTPPLHLYHDGPAGFAFNPGTAINSFYKNHFFMTGFPARKLHAFQLKPKGASFEISGDHIVARGVLMVGLDFGPDGALYIADWSARGYELNEKGGLWKLDDPRESGSSLRKKTAGLLNSNWSKPSLDQITKELANPDQRVRMKAQFELVRRQETKSLISVALDQSSPQLARIHAIWGLGQNLRLTGKALPESYSKLYTDKDSEIRAQAARTAGDSGHPDLITASPFIKLLKDPAERPRFFAALALGSKMHEQGFSELVSYLGNDGNAPFHRHAGIMGLITNGSPEQLAALSQNPSQDIKLAAVVALRRLSSPQVAIFLNDRDPIVITEAARAIYDDHSIPAAIPQLAALLDQPSTLNEATFRRALASAFRLRDPKQALRVAKIAANKDVADNLRFTALQLLQEWPKPGKLDSVQGRYEELRPISAATIAPVIKTILEPLLDAKDKPLREAARASGSIYGFGTDPAKLLALVKKDDPDHSPGALRLLASAPKLQLAAALGALSSKHPSIRTAALTTLAKLDPMNFPNHAHQILDKSHDIIDRRAAINGLSPNGGPGAIKLLTELLKKLSNQEIPPELVLDLLETTRSFKNESLSKDRQSYLAKQKDQALAPYAGTLHGGDSTKGRDLFNNHISAQCIRCHAIGNGGSEVGPNLSAIGKKDPDYLLAAIVDPGRDVAMGFGIATVTLKDGTTLAGALHEKSDQAITLKLPSGKKRSIPIAEITSQTAPVSSMPPIGAILDKKELRDILAYLQTLK